MDKIRFAVIGTNFITERFLKAASLCEDFELMAVYSRNMERAREFAARYKASYTFDELDDLADCPHVDAVYIASPTAHHSRQTLMMLRGQKHVLCEKPAASNSLELESMIQLSENRKLVFLEAICNVFTPGFDVICKNLEHIGKVRRATFIFCRQSSRYDKYKQGIVENAFRPELSNGAIMDIGVYGIHLLTSLFGTPFSVTAKGHVFPGSIDVSGVLIGKYKDMQAEVLYSKISTSYMPSEIQGEDGSILFSTLSAPSKIKVILNNGHKKNYVPEMKDPDLYYEIRAFIDMIKGKRTDVCHYNEQSILTMRIMDDARKQMDIVFPSDF